MRERYLRVEAEGILPRHHELGRLAPGLVGGWLHPRGGYWRTQNSRSCFRYKSHKLPICGNRYSMKPQSIEKPCLKSCEWGLGELRMWNLYVVNCFHYNVACD